MSMPMPTSPYIIGESSDLSDLKIKVTRLQEDLPKNLEDSLRLHFSRQEQILKKCLARLDSLKISGAHQGHPENNTSSRSEVAGNDTDQHDELAAFIDTETAAAVLEKAMSYQVNGEWNGSSSEHEELTESKALLPIYESLRNIEGTLFEMGCELRNRDIDDALLEEVSSPMFGDSEGARPRTTKTMSAQMSRMTIAPTALVLEGGAVAQQRRGRTSGTIPSDSALHWWASSMETKLNSGSSTPFQRRIFRRVSECLQWWDSYQEPPRDSRLARLTDSRYFETLCATVILTNAVFTLFTTNWEIQNLGARQNDHILILEMMFLGFYSIELLMKLCVHRLFYFIGDDWRWNAFDLFLVAFSVYDQLTSNVVADDKSEGGDGLNLSFMRSFRVFKLAKILRAVRAMRFITQLRLMLNSIMGSFISLFWSFVMLTFIFYIFSLIFVQGTIQFLIKHKDDLDNPKFDNLMKYFGSVQEGMISLLKATTGGMDWEVFYDSMVISGSLNAGCFVFFIAFFQISLLNVLTGIFVENAMKLAQPDPYTRALEERKVEIMEADELRRACKRLDKGHHGYITAEEFETEIQHGKLRAHLRVLGLDVRDPHKFFHALQHASGQTEIGIDEFVKGCLKLKGPASSIDLQSLIADSHILQHNQHEMKSYMEGRLDKIVTPAALEFALSSSKRQGPSIYSDPMTSTQSLLRSRTCPISKRNVGSATRSKTSELPLLKL